tara:strand:+ start:1383 stop:1592 length:210 start_codon:yes stop_codon:yes gene_type:complete
MDIATLNLIGQYLIEKEKLEWADVLKEFILIHQATYSDSDDDYSEDEGSAEEEEPQEYVIDHQGFHALV